MPKDTSEKSTPREGSQTGDRAGEDSKKPQASDRPSDGDKADAEDTLKVVDPKSGP